MDSDWLALNRANWEDRVPVHLASSFYDLAAFRAGQRDTLHPFQVDAVGDVSGRRLVHLQCHIGLDTLSWSRRGAQVTGLDFSPAAIAAATELGSSLGLGATFVVSDVYDAPRALGGEVFDVVYTGIGALVWLPDIERWASVVASLLAPGGFLYLVEGHPVAQVLSPVPGSEDLAVAYDYFDSAPQVEDYPYTYTDGPALTATRSVQFQHSLGSVVTALTSAGLQMEFMREHDFDTFQRYPSLARDAEGLWRLPAGRPRVPLLFSVRASRPGG
jgi:SAM-dependent methyltransferase